MSDGTGRLRRLRRRASLAGWVVVGAVALVACGGTAPDYQFVANTDRSMVVKLPAGWTALDASKIRGAAATSDRWFAYYDAARKPSDAHADVGAPADSLSAPVVQMLTVKLPAGTAQQLTEDDLKDMLLPTSRKGVLRLAIQAQINVDPDIGFLPLEEQQIENKLATGIRLTYAYNFGNGVTFREKVVLVDRKGSHLYAIEAACSETCFNDHKAQIDSVLDSFTVKPPG